MPEVTFRIRWPDGREEACYSPSSVVREFLAPQTTYSLAEFLERSRTALDRAALRVEAKHGFRCSLADAQAARLAQGATRFSPDEEVLCLSMQ